MRIAPNEVAALRRPVLVRLGVALVPLAAGLVAWGWWAGLAGVRETRGELQRLIERRSALEEANRELRQKLAGVREDREARARAAREVLHVAAPDEIVVILPSPTPALSP